jgi:hypothetical protein
MKKYILERVEIVSMPETPLSLDKRDCREFLAFCQDYLKLNRVPSIEWRGLDWSRENGSFASWSPSGIIVVDEGRHPMDWMRSLAHELVHHGQWERGEELDGSTGSRCENEANAEAGAIMRLWKDQVNEF